MNTNQNADTTSTKNAAAGNPQAGNNNADTAKKAAKEAEIQAEIQKFKDAAAQGKLKQALEEEVKAEIQKAKDKNKNVK
jgi:hypothetical protein